MAATVAGLLRVLVKHINEPIFMDSNNAILGKAVACLQQHLAAQPPLVPHHVQESLLTMHSMPSLSQLQGAMAQVDDQSLDSLRPLLLFLQQWCFRQKDKYYAGLQAVTGLFGPVLLPLGIKTRRALQAQQALAWIIGSAFNIFQPSLTAIQSASPPVKTPSAPGASTPPTAVHSTAAPTMVLQKTGRHAAAAASFAASKSPEAEYEPWMEPAFMQLASRLVSATVNDYLFCDDGEQALSAPEDPPIKGVADAKPNPPTLIQLPVIPAWAAPATAVPACAARLADLEAETGVLCIVRTPTKTAKGCSLALHDSAVATPPSDSRVGVQRSASAPLVATQDLAAAAAVAAVASQLNNMQLMLQDDFGASKSSGALGMWRRSSSLESISLIC